MAEIVLKADIPHKNIDLIKVSSAGLKATIGQKATPAAQSACLLKGFDLSKHRSQQANELLLKSSNLILCMEIKQKQFLCESFPVLSSRIHTLTGFSKGIDENIADPFGCSSQIYNDTLSRIVSEIKSCFTSTTTETQEFRSLFADQEKN